ncbi:MAG TPA: glycosyltransferase [Blastocatellia bacterium]|nr:glycosyltransferase [Blastocatellia bacterium]
MRILLTSSQRYPASVGGFAGCRVFDFLAKGLAEQGHEVFYYLPQGAAVPPPHGIIATETPPLDVDIVHVQGSDLFDLLAAQRMPWVRTCHVDLQLKGESRGIAKSNWIFVSRTLAETYGSSRYVRNGIDPSELIYSESKQDYFLFVCGLERALDKGLDTAISLSREMGFHLVVAGSSRDRRRVEAIRSLCHKNGAEYVGEVWGTQKATLFAHAKALLFPTKWNEAFGLVIPEALMSGTPVITSDKGACEELVTPDVGFVCRSDEDYRAAVERVGEVSAAACREKAIAEFHYSRMASDYVTEYRNEIEEWNAGRTESDCLIARGKQIAIPSAFPVE